MKSKSVLVGISGGVDSAVAAHLLKETGYRVKGLYLYNGFPNRAEEDAVFVASRLSIPLHSIDISKFFREDIVQYFVSEYAEARTPNPCIVCNKKIKFKYLLYEAQKSGLDYIATGHYARVEHDVTDNCFKIMRGKDRKKDQSYFLFQLGQDELSRVLFPNGEQNKEAVRKIGADLGLGSLTERESQEICFIPDNNYRGFIEREVSHSPFRPGNIMDGNGKIVGRHRGIHSVTVGQRRGLNIASERPYYVLEIDRVKNEVIVGRSEDQYFTGLIADNCTWTTSEYAVKDYLEARIYIRYRHRGVDSVIMPQAPDCDDSGSNAYGRTVIVRFATPQKAVAPGQAAVFYQEDTVIGGGWITGGIRGD